MSTGAGLAFAGGAALLIGVYLFVYKRFLSHYPGFVYLAVVQGVAAAWYVPIGVATWPDGRRALAGTDALAGAVLAAVLVLTAGAAITAVYALKLGEISYVAPLSKLIPPFVLPLEVLAYGNVVSATQAVGIGVATTAVYVANYERGGLLTPFRRALTYRPAQLALGSAALFACVDLGKRTLLQEYDLSVQVLVFASLAGMAALAARQWPDGGVRRDAGAFLATGLLVAAGQHVAALAFQSLPASVASPVVNVQAVVAVVLGGAVLRERAFGRRLGAAALALAGIALIALG